MKSLFLLALASVSLLQAETLISWQRVQLTDQFYAEGATYADLNKDGHMDIISGPFWYEGPDWKKAHAFYEPKVFSIHGYSDNFFSYPHDFNGDGWQDLLVLGFPGKEARLYLNPGRFDQDKDTPWAMHIVADVVDNESPVFTDITGDGKPEIVCSTGGRFGWFAPDWSKPTEKWTFHAVTGDMKVAKFTHGLGVGDVDGDGKMDLLEARRWWQAGSGDTWTQHNFAAGVGGGAQMFAYDFDGDGRNDVATALSAHRYGVAVFMNRSDAGTPTRTSDPAGKSAHPTWEKRTLVGEQPWENDYGIVFSQPHAMSLVDVDGDGVKDLVTGKRYWAHNGHGDPDEHGARVVYWFQTKRDGKGGVEFIPHLVDAESGVGVDVQTGDVNGDQLQDIIVGNKSGVYVLLQERQEVSPELAEQMRPKKLYGPGLMPQSDYQAGQSPQDAVKNLQLPAGFKAELIASEPEVVQPIAMTWDERGRLWVIEGNSYPKPREPGAGQDRILIFEDKDGNGKFETRKVFAEGISLASGIEIGFGGVWVGAAPYLMFIPDADRDDVPDQKHESYAAFPQVPGLKFTAYALLDGWGSQDTHETLNSFIWGPDGWLYGCQGVFTHSKVGKVGTPDEQREPLNACVWRYHPVRHVFEVFAHGTSNPWGLDYDEHGEFFVTACVIPHLYHIVPGGRYFRQAGQHFNPYTYDDIKTIADHAHYAGDIRANAHWGARREGGIVADDTNQAGGGHAHCGLAIYQSDQFPASYRNQLLFGNLHGHRLVNNYLDPKGSTYIGRHGSDFLRSNDMYFIPVTQKVGPDGSLYVSDWSDKQVCHRGSNAIEMWDRSNGRIYRVSYGPSDAGTPARKEGHALQFPQAPFDLTQESDESLVRLAVQTENEWFARMAKRVLMERTTVETSRFASIAPILERTPSTQETSALRSLWLSLSAGGTTPIATPKANEGFDHLRAWQVRAKAAGSSSTGLSELAKQDASPVVRRELASALQRLPLESRSDIATALLHHEEDKDDPYIPLLIWYGIEPVVGADAEAGLKLATASKMPTVTEFIYRRLGSEEKGREALLGIAAQSPDAAQRETLLRTVVEAARAGGKVALPSAWPEWKTQLGASDLVQELEAFMGVETALAAYRQTLVSQSSLAQREAALRILMQVRDAQTAGLLHQLLQGEDKTLIRRVVQALATLPHEDTPALLLEKFASFDANLQTDVINTLATTPAGARGLLLAVKEGKVARSALSPFLVRQMDALKDAEVRRLIPQVWGDLNAPKPDLEQRKVKFRTTLSKEALARADAKQGKLIFSATCGTCHRLLGEGQDVGPDLTGSNRGDLDYLLDNVLDPNAVIGKDYQLNIFELQDGRIASGVIKEETAAAYRVAMPGGIEQMVTKAEIKKRTVSPVSTMPEGLFDALPADSLLHLVKYLQSQTSASKGTSIKGAQEGEKLKTEASIGKAKVQPMGNFKEGHWSGDQHLWWTGGKVGNTLKIRFTKTQPGKQKLHAVFTKAPDYGIVSFQVAGQACALGDLDLYDPQVVNTPELQLGEFDLPPGECELVVTIQGHNAAAKPALMFALDYLRWE
ncbi:putative membrane-bound dehydrogenase domain-containing protein [Prosthecobacter debontii]|uniref:Putative membrane-bound dehydrogenase domain-containing protein n=1 Tax=Prosthecobacter debontii TaxID=48467 RepID=A0A1T4Y5R9_9BACT|nr:PVC-type heme-binding CxxCH protein [Prosthecobacter debontii]SKA96848.1 putative membrane-bound dehydrogenase domain-containing protein [Prosthecobacter debontii]